MNVRTTPPRSWRSASSLALLVVGATLLACSTTGSGAEDSLPSPRETVAPSTAVAAVQSFDPADEHGVARLNAVVQAGGDFVPEVAELLEADDPNTRWAALYLVALSAGTDAEIDLLRPMLSDADPILRVMAAGSLAGHGVVEALPVLIEGLSSDAELPYSEPSFPVSAFARRALEQYTRQSFADAAGWQAWWADSATRLRWEDGHYVID